MKQFTHGTAEAPVSTGDRSRDRYVDSEYQHIHWLIGPYQTVMQALLKVNDRMVDKIVVRTPAGTQHVFFFDIDAPMKSWRETFEKAAKKMGIGDLAGETLESRLPTAFVGAGIFFTGLVIQLIAKGKTSQNIGFALEITGGAITFGAAAGLPRGW